MFGKKNKKSKEQAVPLKEVQAAAGAVQPQKDDGELIAVLAAAVATVLGTAPNGIVIRSYKRVNPSAWKSSGRDFQILNHL